VCALNYLAGMVARNRNQNFLPKSQLLMACESQHKMCNAVLWQHWSSMRALPSKTWLDGFVEDALKHHPGPSYPVLDFVSAAVFDNYTEQVNYQATHNADTQGERLDMTNWATVWLPRSTLRHISIGDLSGGKRLSVMFKEGFHKAVVADLCHPHHPDILAKQVRRWNESFQRIRDGSYFDRPGFVPAVAHDFFITHRSTASCS